MAPTSIVTDTVVVLPRIDGLSVIADGELIDLQRRAGVARRKVDAVNAAIAGEIARRSDRSLGHKGLAATLGAATPEAAIQSLTGVSLTDAKAMTAVGAALDADSPWLAPVLEGVSNGTLSVASAAAIANGLGAPSDNVAADDLLDGAEELVEFAKQSTPENTAKSARNLRERLDVASIADLEAHRRSRRSLKWFEQADGTTRMVAVLDPESAAIITGALDTAMSPRRGGPRFVDAEQMPGHRGSAGDGAGEGAGDGALGSDARGNAGDGALRSDAEHRIDDSRTNEQVAVDTLVDIVTLAERAANSELDPARIFGERSPAVRVHVPVEALTSGDGAAHIEGQSALVSVTTAERYVCTSGTVSILFAGDTAIDVSATQRLHSARQRIAIAAQWNGCAWPGCQRPPAMTEVHHMHAFNGHNTTLANAVPLCRFHHMQLHANAWSVTRRDDGTYWLIPPESARGLTGTSGTSGTSGRAEQLHSKSPLPKPRR